MQIRSADKSSAAGIQLSLAGYFLFGSSDMLDKALTHNTPVFQVVLLQVLFALVPLFIVQLKQGG